MKTYLTPAEFAAVFWHRHKIQTHNSPHAGVGDKITWSLFQGYEQEIKETLAGSLYGIDAFEGADPVDLIGHQFHKSFRQTDPIDAPHLNHVIWTCLGDAPLFWRSLEMAGKILISEDLSAHYRELLFDTTAVAS